MEETIVWGLFFLLNSFLFLPKYIFEFKTSTFLPYKGFFKGTVFERFGYIFVRYNYDIFRISVDLFVVLLFTFLFRDYLSFPTTTFLLTLFFLVIFSYQIYYVSFEKLFNVEPVFYNDINMFKTGLTLITAESFIKLFFIGSGIIALSGGVYFIIKLTLSKLWLFTPGVLSIGLAIFLLSCSFISLKRYKLFFRPRQGFQSLTLSILNNIIVSLEAKKNLKKFNIDILNKRCDYSKVELNSKPNIILVAVESYGRVVIDNPELFDSYSKYMTDHEEELKKNNFQTSSILSTAPISGGGSWVSYSSILYGFNIMNQGTYHALFKKKELDSYENMMRFFKKRGYKNYYLNSLAGYEKITIPWDDLSRFYGVDEWITFKDLNYKSNLFGFGPAPPDQYTLNFGYNYIKKSSKQPFTLFFLTQNSHNPFYTLPELVDDWKSLNKIEVNEHQTSRFLVKPNLDNYRKAIKYQMDFLFDFIIKNASENDVFILVGDHQPIVVTDEKDGKETPLHIISKDVDFINQFEKYSFTEGLLVNRSNKIRHEGIYSMFIKEMALRYGTNTFDLPEYYPEGTAF